MIGEWLVDDINADALERFREARPAASGGWVGVNRNLAFLSACFSWAWDREYVERNPFERGTRTIVKLTKEFRRSRRL